MWIYALLSWKDSSTSETLVFYSDHVRLHVYPIFIHLTQLNLWESFWLATSYGIRSSMNRTFSFNSIVFGVGRRRLFWI